MENFELVPLHNGVMSLRCLEPRETFHPAIGPSEEARLLHVEQLKICERRSGVDHFQLWDVGLGAAANAVTAIKALKNQQSTVPVTIHSFDKTTKPLEFALQNAAELGYLLDYQVLIQELLKNHSVRISDTVEWKLHLGDFSQLIKTLELRAPDAIFYDPYSAKANPEMWSLETFKLLYSKLDPARPCVLSNYTASTYVRVTLLLAGFCVGMGRAVDKKIQTTLASNSLSELQDPLTSQNWLYRRALISHSAAPIRDIPHKIAPLNGADFERLMQLEQFKL